MKPPFGVFEIFYGEPWSDRDRASYASLLKDIGFDFYLYGPKADEALRKNWQNPLSREEIKKYQDIRKCFVDKGLRFSMALSPHGLNFGIDEKKRSLLRDKVKGLADLGLDTLGLFFDDMKSTPDMARRQLDIVHAIEQSTNVKLLFCPSFYCFDPLLDLLFGDRPEGYLETIGRELSPKIEILWTGEQIISPEITVDHLRSVSGLLGRKPYICDNFYADDGPINCSFLKILPPTGRSREVFSEASQWAINPMNQAHLSKLVLLAFSKYVRDGVDPMKAFESTVQSFCSKPTADLVMANYKKFSEEGLDALRPDEKATLSLQLKNGSGGDVEGEIAKWLAGGYAVGFEEVVDQSCFNEA